MSNSLEKNSKGHDYPEYNSLLMKEEFYSTKYSWFNYIPRTVSINLNFVPIIIEEIDNEFFEIVTGMKLSSDKKDICLPDTIYGIVGDECDKRDVVKVLRYLEDNKLIDKYAISLEDFRFNQINNYNEDLKRKSLEIKQLDKENKNADDYLIQFKKRYRE